MTNKLDQLALGLVQKRGEGHLPKIPDDNKVMISIIVYALILASVVFLHIYDSRKARKKGDAEVFYYKPRSGEAYNEGFYEHIERLYLGAKRQIIMTGDGFQCDTDASVKKARSYVGKMESMLKKDVKILRVQTETTTHEIWAKLMGRLVEDYPEHFKLYILRDNSSFLETNICAIDPETEEANSLYIMYTTERFLTDRNQSLATFAMVVENDREFAKEIGKRVRTLTTDKFSVKVESFNETVNALTTGKVGKEVVDGGLLKEDPAEGDPAKDEQLVEKE